MVVVIVWLVACPWYCRDAGNTGTKKSYIYDLMVGVDELIARGCVTMVVQ